MKKLALFLALLYSVCTFAQVEKYIPDPPNPPRLVNDFAHLLSPDQVQYLERKLKVYDDSTSNQIAIVTVTDLHDYAAVDYAVALGRKWGVGGKNFNNGVIVLVSTGGASGQRDAFIAPGLGLEGAIPDITAKAIFESELIPNLKSGDYYTAFNRTADALIKAAAGEYKAPAGYRARSGTGGFSAGKLFLGIIIIIILLSVFGGNNNKGGGYTSRRGYSSLLWPTIFSGLGGGGGGWGNSGGSSSGGGFGGFGGGSFGGGGAGGSW